MSRTQLLTSSFVLSGSLMLGGLIGCDRDEPVTPATPPTTPAPTTPAPTVGERVGNGMNNAGDALQRSADEAGDAIDNAVDATGNAASRAGAELRAATQPSTLPR